MAEAQQRPTTGNADSDIALAPLYARAGFLIRRAEQRADMMLAEIGGGITRTQFGMMFVLSRLDGLDQRQLGDLLRIDRSTTGLVVDLLERKGYVRRCSAAADRRRKIVSMTESGRRAFPAIERAAEAAQERLLAGLSSSERTELRRLLAKVVGETVSAGEIS